MTTQCSDDMLGILATTAVAILAMILRCAARSVARPKGKRVSRAVPRGGGEGSNGSISDS
jgi:hypothetical protein